MTQLLVSVRNEEEAGEALRGGADWIDLKEPTMGALGYVNKEVAERVVDSVGSRSPLSAAAGDLRDWVGSGPAPVFGVRGLKLLKIGLAHNQEPCWKDILLDVQSELAFFGQELVPVIYADFNKAGSPSPAEILSFAQLASCAWVLIDTFDKRTGSLLDYVDRPAIVDLLGAMRDRGLRTAVAGRLTAEIMASLPLELIDVVGVRGAACRGDRLGAVCAERVAKLQAALRGSD
jgi:uncharacterized protein (UPF0264 family)